MISQLLESLTTSVTFSFSKCSSIRLWLNHMVHGKFNSPYSSSQKPSAWDCCCVSCHCPQLPHLTLFRPLLDGWPKNPLGCSLGSTDGEEGLPAFLYNPCGSLFLPCSEEHPGSDNIPHSFSERQVSKIRNECHVSVGVMGRRQRCTFLSSWFGSSSPALE